MQHDNTSASHRLRKSRTTLAGYYYLITTGTLDREPLFRNADAAQAVMETLRWLHEQQRIQLITAVVMPDHLHFIATLLAGPWSAVMHSLKGFSAKQVNAVLRRTGVVWQAQYHDHVLREDADLRAAALYCLCNPVRAGLVSDFHAYPHWWCCWDV